MHRQMDVEQVKFINVHCVKLYVQLFKAIFLFVRTFATHTFRTPSTHALINEAQEIRTWTVSSSWSWARSGAGLVFSACP